MFVGPNTYSQGIWKTRVYESVLEGLITVSLATEEIPKGSE